MKKIVLLLFAFIYLGISSGISMSIHYCMGQKVGTSLFYDEHEKCGKCGMTEKKSGCCKDEIKFYKLDNAHKHPAFVTGIEKNFSTVRFFSKEFSILSHLPCELTPFPPSISPGQFKHRLHLVYCTFLI